MFPSENPEEIHSKYAVILLGKTTHLLAESQLVSDVVKRSHSGLREDYAKKLVNEPLVSIGLAEIFRFTWGQKDSPVHSEPDLKGDRVFVSALYGTEGEIKTMCTMRQENYGEQNDSGDSK